MTEDLHIVIRKITHRDDDDVPYVEEHNIPFEKFIEMFMDRLGNQGGWQAGPNMPGEDGCDDVYQPSCCGSCDKAE